MSVTLAFDVYGTLIDTHGITVQLEKYLGAEAVGFAKHWREKQLEYSFRRALMQNYANFSVCISHALDYTCACFHVALHRQEKKELLNAYQELPAFDDVTEGLARARESGFRMFAFSNGTAEAVETLLSNAGIRDYFLGVISVDEVKSFKPNPGVYSYFLRASGAVGADAWLISSNPFDVIGAISSGMRGVWIRRSVDAIFDPWGIEPTVTVSNLSDLVEHIR
jgi:2-haloacid dehalogenase